MSRTNGINSVVISDDFSTFYAIAELGSESDARKAIGSALKRSGKSGLTLAAKSVQEQYIVSPSVFKKYTWIKTKFKDNKYITMTEMEIYGYHIPLIKFDTQTNKNGRVNTRVNQSSTKTMLDHVFKQAVGKYGHIGTFERSTRRKLPIEEKFGPSGPQMIYSNEEVMDSIVDKVEETYSQRLDHEIMAILNGWRKPSQKRYSLDEWADLNK